MYEAVCLNLNCFRVQAELRMDRHTHTDLLQEPHEARRRHDTDFPHKSLCYRQAPLLLAAAFWVRLQGEESNIVFKINAYRGSAG